MPEQDTTDRLLTAIESLQSEVREVRDEGRTRSTESAKANAELRDAVQRMERTVRLQGDDIAKHGTALATMSEQLDAHYRLIQTLTATQASNGQLLSKHAELITNLGEAVAAAKDRSREAQKSAEDLKTYTEEFQRAVTRHVTDTTAAMRQDMGSLKDDNLQTAVQLESLSVSTGAIIGALELETQVAQAKKGLPPDRKDRTALDTLRSKNQGTMVASIITAVLFALRIIWEVLQQGHILPPEPVQPAPQVEVDRKPTKP